MMVMMTDPVHSSLFCRGKDKRFSGKQKIYVFFFGMNEYL